MRRRVPLWREPGRQWQLHGDQSVAGHGSHHGAAPARITASQRGDVNYKPATNVPQNFAINKANQTITFDALANKTFAILISQSMRRRVPLWR
jgi:hypothetical protein